MILIWGKGTEMAAGTFKVLHLGTGGGMIFLRGLAALECLRALDGIGEGGRLGVQVECLTADCGWTDIDPCSSRMKEGPGGWVGLECSS
jgi:hypothetical protein